MKRPDGLCVAAQETAPCSEARTPRKGSPGSLRDNINPEPARAAGSDQRRTDPPMGNQTAEAGRCCEHRTELPPVHARA
jgi:hypothetical protein